VVQANRKKIEIILLWCKRKWGKSKFKKDYPKLRVYTTAKGTYNSSRSSFGTYNYDTNTINIHVCHHKSYNQLIDTVIHEYKHYLLNTKEYKKLEKILYKRFLNDHGNAYRYISQNLSDSTTIEDVKCYIADIHPHEKKSVRLAKIWSKKCLNELKKDLYSRK
jgi:hypothetical protein